MSLLLNPISHPVSPIWTPVIGEEVGRFQHRSFQYFVRHLQLCISREFFLYFYFYALCLLLSCIFYTSHFVRFIVFLKYSSFDLNTFI
jgi:hypothetical protein